MMKAGERILIRTLAKLENIAESIALSALFVDAVAELVEDENHRLNIFGRIINPVVRNVHSCNVATCRIMQGEGFVNEKSIIAALFLYLWEDLDLSFCGGGGVEGRVSPVGVAYRLSVTHTRVTVATIATTRRRSVGQKA
jgi:hypothetical protein